MAPRKKDAGEGGSISPAMQDTLRAIRLYVAEHGIPPSTRDLVRLRGLSSPSSVQRCIDGLTAAGAISTRPGVPRSIRVLWPDDKGSAA